MLILVHCNTFQWQEVNVEIIHPQSPFSLIFVSLQGLSSVPMVIDDVKISEGKCTNTISKYGDHEECCYKLKTHTSSINTTQYNK